MNESTHDCGHDCCDERANPFHDHFLDAEDCPDCGPIRQGKREAEAEIERLTAEVRRLEQGDC